MLTNQQLQRRSTAADELSQGFPHLRSALLVDSLSAGLTRLRNLLLTRIHDDVEQYFGVDSMIAPTSVKEEKKQSLTAQYEIEIYSAIVADDEVSHGHYTEHTDEWFLDWLFRLRLGEGHHALSQRRVRYYRSASVEDRRLKFVSILQRAVPEAAKTPLVLFRLFPRAVRIAVAVAFGDPLRAQELRAEQCRFLPAVCDCHECEGRVLDNEEICPACGNPVWEFSWLDSD